MGTAPASGRNSPMEETSKHTRAIIQIGTKVMSPSRGSDGNSVRQRNKPFQKVRVVKEGFPEEEGPQWASRNGPGHLQAATAQRGAQDKGPWIAGPFPLLMRG